MAFDNIQSLVKVILFPGVGRVIQIPSTIYTIECLKYLNTIFKVLRVI